jgi:ABC-type uncharacterized transport system YnjBCD substrate-binding protein
MYSKGVWLLQDGGLATMFTEEKIMDIKYNADIGAFVNTANDEPVTQAELLEWAAANPEPIKEA